MKVYAYSERRAEVISVVYKDKRPQAQSAIIGKAILWLEIGTDAAWLRGSKGRKKLRVVPVGRGDSTLLAVRGKTTLAVGYIMQDSLKEGLDALKDYCAGKGRRNPLVEERDLQHFLFRLAERMEIVPKQKGIIEAMDALMSREDFQFGKDYTFLYNS